MNINVAICSKLILWLVFLCDQIRVIMTGLIKVTSDIDAMKRRFMIYIFYSFLADLHGLHFKQ